MQSTRTSRFLALFLCALVLPAVSVRSVEITRDEMLASYIFRLAEHIQWAQEAEISEYRIHLIGDTRGVARHLERIGRARTLHEKPFAVSRGTKTEVPAGTHLAFVSRQELDRYTDLFDRVEGQNVLLISDGMHDQRWVMINLVDTPEQQIRFEINKANILNQNLGIKPDIILLGGTEIDVAKLYREGQESLKAIERTIAEREVKRQELEAKLADISKDLQEQSLLIEERETLIKELHSNANKEKARNKDLAQRAEEQKALIESLHAMTEEERKKQEALHAEAQKQEAALRAQKLEIEKRAEMIRTQDAEIAQQQDSLLKQKSTIETQQLLLMLLSVAGVTVIVMAIVAYSAYRQKLRANALLTTQKQQLEEAGKALDEARKKADAASEAKSLFVAGMSHELRTPLNAVLGFSELMAADKTLKAHQKANLDNINRAGHHLLQLINDVLDMSKIEAGKMELEPTDIDLGNLIRDVIEMMKVRAEEKGLRLLFDQSSEFPRFVRADGPKIRQILVNLLSNAIKFTDRGGVTLRLDAKNGDPDRISLRGEVQDSGCGMDDEGKQRVFRPFEQLVNSVNQKGTGLGLAITRQYVELMDGNISVESELDTGTTVSFQIFVTPGIPGMAHPLVGLDKRHVVGLAGPKQEWRILVAEDNLDNQLLLRQLLERAGLTVRTANDGEEAVRVFEEWKPHLIWMDRRMPHVDGLAATKRIRKLSGGADVKIIAITASVFREQRDEVMNAGSDGFVRKPFRAAEIFDCMSEHLDLHYVYQEGESETREAALDMSVLSEERVAALPANLRSDLAMAIRHLDLDRISSTLSAMSGSDPELTTAMEHMVAVFQFKAIKSLLDSAESGDA